MPHSVSARKRVRQNEKRNLRNRTIKSELKSMAKRVLALAESGDAAAAAESLRAAQARLDKAAQKGILHRNTVSRRKSLLARRVAAQAGRKA